MGKWYSNIWLLFLAFGVLAFLCYMAIPRFSVRSFTGTEIRSLSNAKQIVTACRTYALDHDGKFPKSLDDLVPTYLSNDDLANVLVSPFAKDQPVGYLYTPPSLTDTLSVVIEDKFAPAKVHRRIEVYSDSSGRVLNTQ